MKLVAEAWESLRKWTCFDWLWRLSVLCLPWQTRWFQPGIDLGGYPWEQSRLSFYVSWIPMLMVIGYSLWSKTYCHSGRSEHARMRAEIRNPPAGMTAEHRWVPDRARSLSCFGIDSLVRNDSKMIGAFIGFLALFTAFSIYPIASIQWSVQILVVVLWAWAMFVSEIPIEKLGAWFVYSVVPSAILAAVQIDAQAVWGSKWLGMASQNPQTPGVIVMLKDGVRVLRAYGNFPHPALLGAWTAIGSVLSSLFTMRSVSGEKKFWWIITTGLLMSALVFSYSRAAWVAGIIGFGWIGYRIWKDKKQRRAQQAWSYLVIVFASLFLATYPTWSSRIMIHDRLEQQSITQHASSIGTTWGVLKQHPLLGSGLGTAALVVSKLEAGAPQPPHNLIFMILVECGLVGLGLILFVAWRFRSYVHDCLWLVMLVPFALFDHFLWDIWSGMSLFAVVGLIAASKSLHIPPSTDHDHHHHDHPGLFGDVTYKT